MKDAIAIDKQFMEDVHQGLSANKKYLHSKYFYDETGDKLFQEIMQLDEYYLTDEEYAIFQSQKKDILTAFGDDFSLLEFGAGDGFKTKVLLKYFLENQVEFNYLPIDISQNVLELLESDLKKDLPDLEVDILVGEYFKALKMEELENHPSKIVLFLGSNIGNFKNHDELFFLKELRNSLNRGDRVMIGFDLKKDPNVILNAYNDASGVTEKFNLNLLTRINRELGANFNINQFMHYPIYDPITGECRSFLLSKSNQKVTVETNETDYTFKEWEPIFMEISRKYDIETIHLLAAQAGFKVVKDFFSERKYYVDTLWEVDH